MTQDFISIEIIGMKEFRRKIETVRMMVKSPQFARLMNDSVNVGIAFARSLAPKESYLLQSRISGEVRGLGTTEPAIVLGVRGLKYAAVMEYGSRSPSWYPIVPRTKKYLRWFTQGPGGKTVHVPPGVQIPAGLTEVWKQRIMHPPIKAQPYLRPTIAKLRPNIIAAMKRLLKENWKAGSAGVP